MKKHLLLICLFGAFFNGLFAQKNPNQYGIVPKPALLVPEAGIYPGISAERPARYEKAQNVGLGDEGYEIEVGDKGVLVRANGDKGFFYARQTLLQLQDLNRGRLPGVKISDNPRFAWRGMHLDESRHFFGKAFVKQFIDHLASLKMNVMHWHLTDATGWRIEIKKYPKLADVAAWRPDRTGILNSDADTAKIDEPMTYGGYYTQEDIREIVRYAANRHITIIPEIEMPGHTTAALVAYPEYSCTGGPFPMPGGAKNCPYPNFCVGNEATIQFLQDILTEVIDLFPSQYIHIGGDEVERDQWKACAKCQARKKALGLENEAQLQVAFTKQIEDFIRSKGRQLMGWDEIMEGGNLTPSAGVMVWRGEHLLREATAAGHESVVTHNYYFDLYQGNPQYEPVTYGYKPIKEVYVYEPVPADLPAAQKALVKGVQGCLWSENLYNTKDVEYMMFPRVLALAEVAWSGEQQRNWDDFAQRLPALLTWLDKKKVNYAKSIYNPYPEIRYDTVTKGLVGLLEQQLPTGTIHYTLDGSTPTLQSPEYTGPFPLTQAAAIKALAFDGKKAISKETQLAYNPSLSSGKPLTLKHLPAEKYNGRRPETLNNGLYGSTAFHDGNWCGFHGDDVDVVIDLGENQPINTINTRWMEATLSWIYLPVQLTIETSTDGKNYTLLGQFTTEQIAAVHTGRIKNVQVDAKGAAARYVRVYAKNPVQHPVYKADKCWLFLDEVEVR